MSNFLQLKGAKQPTIINDSTNNNTNKNKNNNNRGQERRKNKNIDKVQYDGRL